MKKFFIFLAKALPIIIFFPFYIVYGLCKMTSVWEDGEEFTDFENNPNLSEEEKECLREMRGVKQEVYAKSIANTSYTTDSSFAYYVNPDVDYTSLNTKYNKHKEKLEQIREQKTG